MSTYILAATRETALKLAGLWASGKIPALDRTLDAAEALLALHPMPLRTGLAMWVAKKDKDAPMGFSVDLVRGSEWSRLCAQADIDAWRRDHAATIRPVVEC